MRLLAAFEMSFSSHSEVKVKMRSFTDLQLVRSASLILSSVLISIVWEKLRSLAVWFLQVLEVLFLKYVFTIYAFYNFGELVPVYQQSLFLFF